MKTSMSHAAMSALSLSLGACTLFGGDEKPWCDPHSPLYPNLTAEQLADCNAENEGETGEETPPSGQICHPVWDFNESPATNGDPQLCVPGSEPWGNDSPWQSVALDACHQRSPDFPCRRSWVTPWASDDVCYACNLPLYDSYIALEPFEGLEWWMCESAAPYHRYHPAWSSKAGDPHPSGPNWPLALDCDTNEVQAGICEPVLLDPHAAYNTNETTLAYGEWTCKCASDDDCQAGAVCEAGYTIVGGVPKATLCTWDDGSGTSNGAAPEGPVVYGLTRWEDGLTIVRNNVKVTPSMVVAALSGGLWNDDQLFTSDGMIEHCGPTALCSRFGLQPDDVVSVDVDAALDFVDSGTPLAVYVHKPTGVVQTWTLSLTIP
jgi:hypothetical protein